MQGAIWLLPPSWETVLNPITGLNGPLSANTNYEVRFETIDTAGKSINPTTGAGWDCTLNGLTKPGCSLGRWDFLGK